MRSRLTTRSSGPCGASWAASGRGTCTVVDRSSRSLGIMTRKTKRSPVKLTPPAFAAGDCLAIAIAPSAYGAALVLAAEQEAGKDGMNVIASLDYLGATKPGLSIFERPQLLRPTHGNWRGNADIFATPCAWPELITFVEVVGNIPVMLEAFPVRRTEWAWVTTEPDDALLPEFEEYPCSVSYASWEWLGSQIRMQRRADGRGACD